MTKLNQASLNHIACMLSYYDRTVFDRLSRDTRGAVRGLGFRGTNPSGRVEDRTAILIAETLMTHSTAAAMDIQRDIQSMRLRQLEVFTAPKHLFLMDEGIVQLGLRELDMEGGRPVLPPVQETADAIDAWKAGVSRRRLRVDWEADGESLAEELTELVRLRQLNGIHVSVLQIEWLIFFKTSVPDLNNPRRVLDRIALIESIREAVFFQGFPKVELGSAREMLVLADRIRQLWLSLDHSPLSDHDDDLEALLDRLPPGNLSVTSQQMLTPYFEVREPYPMLQWQLPEKWDREISRSARMGHLIPVRGMITFLSEGKRLVSIDRSSIAAALLQRKEYGLLRELNGVVHLRGKARPSVFHLALKENWPLPALDRLTTEHMHLYWEAVPLMQIAINRKRFDVLPLLVSRSHFSLKTVLFFRDHRQLDTLLNIFREHWRQQRPHVWGAEIKILWCLREHIRLRRAEANEDEVPRWEATEISMDYLIGHLNAREGVAEARQQIGTIGELLAYMRTRFCRGV